MSNLILLKSRAVKDVKKAWYDAAICKYIGA
jgi:hypothetical protein